MEVPITGSHLQQLADKMLQTASSITFGCHPTLTIRVSPSRPMDISRRAVDDVWRAAHLSQGNATASASMPLCVWQGLKTVILRSIQGLDDGKHLFFVFLAAVVRVLTEGTSPLSLSVHDNQLLYRNRIALLRALSTFRPLLEELVDQCSLKHKSSSACGVYFVDSADMLSLWSSVISTRLASAASMTLVRVFKKWIAECRRRAESDAERVTSLRMCLESVVRYPHVAITVAKGPSERSTALLGDDGASSFVALQLTKSFRIDCGHPTGIRLVFARIHRLTSLRESSCDCADPLEEATSSDDDADTGERTTSQESVRLERPLSKDEECAQAVATLLEVTKRCVEFGVTHVVLPSNSLIALERRSDALLSRNTGVQLLPVMDEDAIEQASLMLTGYPPITIAYGSIGDAAIGPSVVSATSIQSIGVDHTVLIVRLATALDASGATALIRPNKQILPPIVLFAPDRMIGDVWRQGIIDGVKVVLSTEFAVRGGAHSFQSLREDLQSAASSSEPAQRIWSSAFAEGCRVIVESCEANKRLVQRSFAAAVNGGDEEEVASVLDSDALMKSVVTQSAEAAEVLLRIGYAVAS